MGITRHYLEECNFMLTRVSDKVCDDDLLTHVFALNKKMNGLSNVKELVDCREITTINLTTEGTTSNARKEQNKPGSNLAILVSEEKEIVFAMARAYQMFSEEYREHVQIFKNYNEAINWLTQDHSHEAEIINEFIKNT